MADTSVDEVTRFIPKTKFFKKIGYVGIETEKSVYKDDLFLFF